MTVIAKTLRTEPAASEQIAQAMPTGPSIPAPPHGSTIPRPTIDPEKLEKFLGGVREQVNGLGPAMEQNRREMYKQFGVPDEKIPDADKN